MTPHIDFCGETAPLDRQPFTIGRDADLVLDDEPEAEVPAQVVDDATVEPDSSPVPSKATEADPEAPSKATEVVSEAAPAPSKATEGAPSDADRGGIAISRHLARVSSPPLNS